MPRFHETQIGKARKIAGFTISMVASAMILMAGSLKISGAAVMQHNMNKITHFGDKVLLVGLLELFCLALYWIPKTSKLGFFFLCSFGGGTIVAEIVAGDLPIAGITLTTLIYVGTMLRKPSLSGLDIQGGRQFHRRHPFARESMITSKGYLALGVLACASLLPAAVFVPPDRDPQWQTSLNGEWTFKLNGPAAEFVQPEFDDSAWAKIRVPGNWEMQGFEEPIYKEPREGQGLYRRKFAVPDAWRGRRLILRFDGVLFGYECWLNGARVGSFESGFNRCDFDVTSLVKLGAADTLAVRVYRRFKGWQFDTNDDWALSGIYRDVTLLSVPTPHKLRGVNHHDLHPAVGRAITAEHSTQDVELMKQGNLNAVRTSHYPPSPALLDICDRRGIYVIDEVPFGFGDKDLTDPTYQDILLRRAEATVARDKNHPCVLIWSIGNENPITPLVVATAKRVKALDPTRYRLLPGAQVTWGKRAPADADLTELAEKPPFVFDLPQRVEILAPHYPYAVWVPGRSRTVNLTDLAGDPRIKSPLVITEYNHALGNAFEGLKERWEVIERERRLSGTFRIKDSRGRCREVRIRASRGRSTTRPRQSAPSTRTSGSPKPRCSTVSATGARTALWMRTDFRRADYWITSKVYSPIVIPRDRVIVQSGAQIVELPVANRHDFTDLAQVTAVRWITVDGTVQSKKHPMHLSLAPRTTGKIRVEVTLPADLSARYRTRLFGDRVRAKSQFNVRNVQESGSLQAVGVNPDGRRSRIASTIRGSLP